MHSEQRNGDGPPPVPFSIGDRGESFAVNQAAADADQSTADADQTKQDSDQTGSDRDDAAAESDQRSSNRDQKAADRDEAADSTHTDAETESYQKSRDEREASTHARVLSHADRSATASARVVTATERDAMAAARDEGARRRDSRAEAVDRSIAASGSPVAEQLQILRIQAAADRTRAAADRERAAADRALAALERTRLEDGLRTAHLDDLTGAYRRGMGRLAISNEIERARRADGRFVIVFVDVDDMKGVNDRHGHAAGDVVLQTLVRIMRSRLRPFDPVIRYGGDEFICGLGGIVLEAVDLRFRDIDSALRGEVGAGISFGIAALEPGETADQLTARADAALLEVKASHARSRIA